jgi:hypothetical protein
MGAEEATMTSDVQVGTVRAEATGTVAQGQAAAGPVEPAGPATPPAEPLRYDHVRFHSTRCYWDFVECRWECSAD